MMTVAPLLSKADDAFALIRLAADPAKFEAIIAELKAAAEASDRARQGAETAISDAAADRAKADAASADAKAQSEAFQTAYKIWDHTRAASESDLAVRREAVSKREAEATRREANAEAHEKILSQREVELVANELASAAKDDEANRKLAVAEKAMADMRVLLGSR